ncbi:hypothetical protein [Pandoravirus japonicus]|uniref:Uncharacterized protein n=1 Tax=Pandoravirus japonicus TaxID=2823154 RepID=A0A811BN69_9VIRU|nr:hypothetical protein [Pandoravirus japonicus]
MSLFPLFPSPVFAIHPFFFFLKQFFHFPMGLFGGGSLSSDPMSFPARASRLTADDDHMIDGPTQQGYVHADKGPIKREKKKKRNTNATSTGGDGPDLFVPFFS